MGGKKKHPEDRRENTNISNVPSFSEIGRRGVEITSRATAGISSTEKRTWAKKKPPGEKR